MGSQAKTRSPLENADPVLYEELKAQVRGQVWSPETKGYNSARRLWNGMIDKHPAFIAQCTGPADVIAAVKFARAHNLPASVRSGGHNVGGKAVCEGGLVIDLSEMNGVRVSPERSLVRVGAGARLGAIDRETQVFGQAVPVGVVSATGIGGLTLHGGMGFLMRHFGLTVDNIAGADIVTADGQLLVADENNHSDLFWALKGGGGNFGVVTSFEFKMHSVGPEVWLGLVMYPYAKTPQVLTFLREFMPQAPDKLQIIALLWSAPTEEPIPEAYQGKPVVVLAACYSGPLEAGEQAIQPLRTIDTPAVDLSGQMPFVELQRLFDADYPEGRRYYWKSLYLQDLNDSVIDALADYGARRPSKLSSVDVWALGGAIGEADPNETAFFHRKMPYLLGIEANWDDPTEDQANIDWVREGFEEMQQFSPGGAYLNFPGFLEEGEKLLQQSYGTNYTRLQQVKAKYDPDNFFQENFNISAKA